MSKGRPIYSRPRTKVYETNYNIGESYYRPALDRLDRKYGGGFGGYGAPAPSNGDIFGVRAPPPPPPSIDLPPPPPRGSLRELEEDDFFGDGPRRRPNSALLGEFDAIFEGRLRNGLQREKTPIRGGKTLEDEIEEDLSSSMRKLRTVKAARQIADEFDEIESNFRKDVKGRKALDFSEKVMDSVGLTNRARQALEDEGTTVGRRKYLKMTSDISEGDDLTKWTALRPSGGSSNRRLMLDDEEETVAQTAAAARARKSRARLEDLESEMQALSEKSAAREKRVRDLKALVQDNESSALDNLQTTVRVKSSIQSEKKTLAY